MGRILPILLFLLSSGSAFAWNEAGHMLIASLAFDRLTPAAQRHYIDLLKQHPRFQDDFSAQLPAGLSPEETNRWLFMRAAYWPDLARNFTGPDAQRYHRSTWHYINVRVYLNPSQAKDFGPEEPPSDDPTAAADERRMNVLQALNRNLDILASADTPSADRAVSLCWVLHLLADLHQPCHAGTLYSARFPKGDAGANGILISDLNPDPALAVQAGNARFARLHGYWDDLLGDNPALRVLALMANDLKTDPSLQPERLLEFKNAAKPLDWMRESHAWAADAVYDRQVRSAIRLQEIAPNEPFVPVRLTPAYREIALRVARRRAVLAGLRLAERLSAAAPR